MNEPFRRRRVQCASPTGLHRIAYYEWGDPRNDRVVVCVHGLSRCARDFDALARALATDFRVVTVDLPGRGESDWLAQPLEYIVPTYVNDLVTLIARLDVESVHWVGTSLGALTGMVIAAQPGSPIRRYVANDFGPVITAVALERIGTYIGKAPTFATFAEALAYVRAVSAPFGPHTDAQWHTLTEHVVRPLPEGGFRMHYDPKIAEPYNAQRPFKDTDLWAVWDAVRVPTLLLRGAESDLLTHGTALEMTRRGPKAELVEIPGVGHAPTLLAETQIAPIREFLMRAA
ncbi:MAG: alpha/beta hydrolase [Burkholderiales bacterium]|jgi:pimeloyl-ACP methyl ester carboxylesterase|nr:alpha/beta hydrolase [Burkholderiales bacterium]